MNPAPPHYSNSSWSHSISNPWNSISAFIHIESLNHPYPTHPCGQTSLQTSPYTHINTIPKFHNNIYIQFYTFIISRNSIRIHIQIHIDRRHTTTSTSTYLYIHTFTYTYTCTSMSVCTSISTYHIHVHISHSHSRSHTHNHISTSWSVYTNPTEYSTTTE